MTASEPRPEPLLLIDPTTQRPILMAEIRQSRPFLTGPRSMKAICPFCPGHESETPPAIDGWPEQPRAGRFDASDWDVRVFPNKYPACRHHEVIAEGSLHQEQAGDLDERTWQRVVAVWQRRIRAIESQPGVGCAFLFKNVGAAAGASIAHSHSQLLGLAEPPPRLRLEQLCASELPACPWCTTAASASREGRMVVETDHHVVLAPEPPKLPNETWVLPKRCDDDFLTTDAASLGRALHQLFIAVRDALSRPAWNLWLHRLPGARFHWHFELQPRTGQLAGLELGGDMYINSHPAAASAARLRQHIPQ
jgi:UDPglucose--hexose-1-phosphate uridylyltransferase